MHFLFPSHPLRAAVIDDMFAGQRDALIAASHTASLVPDAVISGGKPLRNVAAGAVIVYRGWMLNAADYVRLDEAVRVTGATLLTSPADYLACHHLPNWYPLINEFTPETRVFPVTSDLERELRSLVWDQFFVKDYVKSLKTSTGSMIRDPSMIGTVIEEMKHFRGEIEGGFCVRRVEPFVAESERRYFVFRGKPFAPAGEAIPPIVHAVAGRLASPFFSVDVIRRTDGALRVVEVGDGQVSDLTGWSADEFSAIEWD